MIDYQKRLEWIIGGAGIAGMIVGILMILSTFL